MNSQSLMGLFALAALALGPLVSTAQAQGGRPPTPVRVDAATLEQVRSMRRVSGEIRSKRRSLVAVREAGLVSELRVREGQRVKKGDVIAQLDAVRLEDDLDVLRAELPQARAIVSERAALLEQSRHDLAVLEELESRDAVNPKELSDARSDVAVAEARHAQSESAVTLIEARMERLRQRISDLAPSAPFDGVVVAHMTEAGQWLAAGATLVELVADTELEAHVDVPQSYYGPLLALEGAIELEVNAAGRRTSSDWRVVPRVASTGRTFPLIVDLADPSGLAPGMSVNAEVPTGELAEQLTVSRDAILRNATGSYVFVVRPGQGEGAPPSAAIAPVDVVFFVGQRAVVRSPAIQPGDEVVVEGNERLYPSAPVQPMPSSGGASERADAPPPGESAANPRTLTISVELANAAPRAVEVDVVAPLEAVLADLGFVLQVDSRAEAKAAELAVTLGPGATGESIGALADAIEQVALPADAQLRMTSTNDDWNARLARRAGRASENGRTEGDAR